MRTREMRLKAAIAALAFGIAGAAHAEPTPGEYNIGIISDDTGPVAAAGISYHRGVDLAIEEVNENGLAGEGVTFNLLVKDSGTDAARAVQAMTQFAADDSVIATTCCIISSIAGALAPIAMQQEIPLVIYGATREGLPEEPYVTSVVALPGPQEVQMAQRLAETVQPETVAYFLAGDNEIFLDRAQAMQEVLEAAGAETVAEITTLTTDTDFTAPATQAMATNPDLILVMTTQQPSVSIISALRQRGYDGVIATSEVISPPAIYQSAGELVEGIPFALSFQPGISDSPEAQAFVEAFQEKYDALPDVYAAQGYTAIQFIAQGFKAIDGEPTRQNLAENMWAISSIDHNVYGGQQMVDGQAQIPETLIVNWNDDGEVALWELE